MRSIKVFISGRVTGLPRAEAQRNFERGKMLLLRNTYEYVNPLDQVPDGSTPTESMKILLPLLVDCDGILLLENHKFSEGSQVEEAVARYCQKQIFHEDDLN